LADILNGDDSNDILFGGKGDDLLNSGFGNDILTGGMGVDGFLLLLSIDSTTDTITDFEDGKNLLIVANGITFSQLAITQSNGITQIGLVSTGKVFASLIIPLAKIRKYPETICVNRCCICPISAVSL
jgi:Ca2+-binding RTX toxin-like protein